MKPTLIILAAGLGSRYGTLKQIDKLGPGGETIIDYSIYDAIQAGFGKVVFVIRKEIEGDFKEMFIDKLKGKIEIDYVFQGLDDLPDGYSPYEGRQKPWGTAHAIWVARNKVDTPFAVINADDFYGRESFIKAANFLRSSEAGPEDYCLIGYCLANTLSEHGYVSRAECHVNSNSYLLSATERTKVKRLENGIFYEADDGQLGRLEENTIVSMNMWGFGTGFFHHLEVYFKKFLDSKGHEAKSEFFIPWVVNELIQNKISRVKVLESSEKWFGMTFKEDREIVINKLQGLHNEGNYPESLF